MQQERDFAETIHVFSDAQSTDQESGCQRDVEVNTYC